MAAAWLSGEVATEAEKDSAGVMPSTEPDGSRGGTLHVSGPHAGEIYVSGPSVEHEDVRVAVEAAVEALLDAHPRVEQGHFFSIVVIP